MVEMSTGVAILQLMRDDPTIPADELVLLPCERMRTPTGARHVTTQQQASAAWPESSTLPNAAFLRQRLRVHTQSEIYDDSCNEPVGLAIYTLSDPRDIRDVRYVGQTRAPRRRFLQHLNHAQLWLADDLPWWVKQPKLRPLYTWIRELYRDQYRLPIMVISAWTTSPAEARAAERARISACLANQLPLLNVETEILRGRIPLF
jgi:hypothetical protein